MRRLGIVFIACLLGLPHGALGKTLPIPAVIQENYVWCWVAVAEMVFRYYGFDNINLNGDYQCGIVNLLADGTRAQACVADCNHCIFPIGSAANFKEALERYPEKLNSLGRSSEFLVVDYSASALSRARIHLQLLVGSPIAAGISPSGRPPGNNTSQHLALIVGARTHDGIEELRVNDPFPFYESRNPYLLAGGREVQRGSYWIGYDSFKTNLSWVESFTFKVTDLRRGSDDDVLLESPNSSDVSPAERCQDQCDKEKFACEYRIDDVCIGRQQNRSDYIACGCPNWLPGNFACRNVCQDAYENAVRCNASRQRQCNQRMDRCESLCK